MATGAAALKWAAMGAAANGAVGAVAARAVPPSDKRVAVGLRATGNGTFAAFAAPFLLGPTRTDRRHWWAYVGAHGVHVAHLIREAGRHRGASEGFSATSRYGGAAGYATIALLAGTSYVPGGAPCPDSTRLRLHRLGEKLLFGLYGFTIAHGYMAKGRNRRLYGLLAALWLIAAAKGRARWPCATSEAHRPLISSSVA
jgi:hypothetical protein